MNTGDDQGRLDLHVHSVASDGTRSVRELAEMARLSGLAGFALTDHDTLTNAAVLQEAATQSRIALWSGVELSVVFAERGVHLLGYGFDSTDANLLALLARLRASRWQRWDYLVAALRKQGARLPAVLPPPPSTKAPGRLHLARALVHHRCVPNVPMAFGVYLKRLAECGDDWPGERVSLEEAVTCLHAAGGCAILAHPPAGLSAALWGQLAALGLDGIEVDHPGLTRNHRQFLRQTALRHGFAITGGSDFHGDRPGEYLGRGGITVADGRELLA